MTNLLDGQPMRTGLGQIASMRQSAWISRSKWYRFESMGRLDQKTVLVTVLVLVTGGANGAGAASVLRFCEEGARLE